jgi:hypothetical protein
MTFCKRGPKGDPGRVLNPGEPGQRGGSAVQMIGIELVTNNVPDQLIDFDRQLRVKSVTVESREVLQRQDRSTFFLSQQSWMVQITVYSREKQAGLVMISLVNQEGVAVGSVVMRNLANTSTLIVPPGVYRMAVRSTCCVPITVMVGILGNI